MSIKTTNQLAQLSEELPWTYSSYEVTGKGGTDVHGVNNNSPKPQGVLINGDNLHVLPMLVERIPKSVKMIYLDPPYNLGNRDFFYEDAFEEDHWLRFMSQSLDYARKLLADNGSICVSIDDEQLAQLRIMMDKIFGRANFVACIAYERSGSAGLGQAGTILNTKEYILFYCLNKDSLNTIGYERPIELETMRRYKRILVSEGKRTLIDELPMRSSDAMARLYLHEDPKIESISLKNYATRSREILRQYVGAFEKVFRTQNVQKENEFQNIIIRKLDKQLLYSLDYIPTRGRYKGAEKTLYYYNAELCAWLKDSARLDGDQLLKWNKLTDFWPHKEIPKADLANEGGIYFPRGKKPEFLLHRLLSMTTSPDDLVLDFFLGSGTTAAVAHKMGRRWIGIEKADFFTQAPLQRLMNVIEGDSSGISSKCNWHGGGAFHYGQMP